MQCDFGVKKLLVLAAVAAVFGTGCGARSTYDFAFDIDPPPPTPPLPEECSDPVGTCGVRRCDPAPVEAMHVELCSELTFTSNPPTSGPHYPIWGLFKSYDKPLARGFYLHDAEHSAVILLYNCEQFPSEAACADAVAAMNAYVADKPADPKCEAPTRNRIIVTPDPQLDVPVAAVAWGHSLKAECFDAAETDAFVEAYYGKNYENFCSGGVDPTDPESGILPGCGFF
jgi:hypothetical protein